MTDNIVSVALWLQSANAYSEAPTSQCLTTQLDDVDAASHAEFTCWKLKIDHHTIRVWYGPLATSNINVNVYDNIWLLEKVT